VAEQRLSASIECRSPNGRHLATIEIVVLGNGPSAGANQSLQVLTEEEALQYGEERVQLRERGRYEYQLTPAPDAPSDLCLLAQRGIQPSRASVMAGDRGLIEPQDHCGYFPLQVVRRGDREQQVVAQSSVEVRSIKLGYREHYRGMMTFIAEQCAGLLLDCRATTQLRLDTLWQQDSHILEQQLEFLRHTLESSTFRTAIDEVLRNPHRHLMEECEVRDIARPFKPGKEFARQVAVATRRVAVPPSHPLHTTIPSLPAQVIAQSRTDFLDTAENRFIKMVLVEFRDFLADVNAHLTRQRPNDEKPETQRLRRETGRLRGLLESQLSRGFLPDVGPPAILPLGSPVLQRKAGYRELLRFWLQFHAGAQLVWDGGADVFLAGARNVATLYEYWLFFQVEALFRQRFACAQPLHALLVDTKKAPPQLILKRGVELKTPVSGVWSQTAGRFLRAEFHFNRKFTRRDDRSKMGSWTRGVQPDYTISIWPAEYAAQEAEENELMVHIHFDAKYRVERVSELLGDELDDSSFEIENETDTKNRSAAKYDDLLKMHAYRDAIRRTAGAYVLYPGNPGDGQAFQGFHEVLPGLGAFAIRPGNDGKAEGIDKLAKFLDQVIDHLANRTTARERVTYHVAETYKPREIKEQPVPYDTLHLPEADLYGKEYRALPPAEEMVLLAWYENEAQLELARDQAGFMYVRLGLRQGALHIHPNVALTRYILLHSKDKIVAPGLLSLRELGYHVYTRLQLRSKIKAHPKGKGVTDWLDTIGKNDEEFIYALFKTCAAPTWDGQRWNGEALMDLIEQFETDKRNKPVENVGRTSAYPRNLPLRDVLKARI
jgi:predicted component of viral defense system (DUF524 family)